MVIKPMRLPLIIIAISTPLWWVFILSYIMGLVEIHYGKETIWLDILVLLMTVGLLIAFAIMLIYLYRSFVKIMNKSSAIFMTLLTMCLYLPVAFYVGFFISIKSALLVGVEIVK